MENSIIQEKAPRISIRVTFLYGWFIPIFILFSLFEFKSPLPYNPFLLTLFSFVGLALALPESLRALKLKRKKESKLVTIIAFILSATSVIILLELKNIGVFYWSELYISVPLVVFSVITFILSFIAEERHNMKIYWALDGVRYVKP